MGGFRKLNSDIRAVHSKRIEKEFIGLLAPASHKNLPAKGKQAFQRFKVGPSISCCVCRFRDIEEPKPGFALQDPFLHINFGEIREIPREFLFRICKA